MSTGKQTINDEYAAQGGKLENLPPSIFKDTDTLLSVLPPTDSLLDDTASHDALLSDLRQLYQSKDHLYLTSVQEQQPPVHSTANSSHLHQVALNPDTVRIVAEQKEQLLADKERVAAQRREEQRHNGTTMNPGKQNQKEKARHAAALRKQKVEMEAASQNLPEEEPHQEIEAKDMDTSGSDSEAELLVHIPSGIIPFCRMNRSIQDRLIHGYNELLPKDFNKHHCPSYIRLVATFKSISTRIRDELIDAQLSTPKPTVNPQDLIYEINGDINEIWVRTPETLKMVLSVL